MRVEDVLELSGIDVVARGDDHALGSSAEVDKALAVHRAEVAGIDPGEPVGVTAQGLGGLVGVLHVFLHHGRTGQQDLALFAVGQLAVRTGLDDLDVGVREGHADTALLEHVRRRQAAGRDGLGGAVALAHLDDGLVVVKEFVQLLFQLDGQGVAAGEHALEAAQIGVFHALHAQHRLVERRHAGDEVAACLDDLLGIVLGIDARDQDAAARSLQDGVDAYAETEAVEHRHGRQHLVAGAIHRVGGHDLLAEGGEVAVRQHDALGLARGAAGVEDHGGVVAPARDLVVVEAGAGEAHEIVPADDRRVLGDLFDLAPLGEHITRLQRLGERVLDAGDDDVDDLRVVADVVKLVIELVERDGRDALGFVEIKLDLLLGGERVDHVGDRSDEVDGIKHVHGLRAVRQRDRDLVVLAHADGLQRAGAAFDLLDHGAVARFSAHKAESDAVRTALRSGVHRVEHRALGVLQMQGNILGVSLPGRFRSDLFHIVLWLLSFYLYSKPLGSPIGRSSISGCAKIWRTSFRLLAK